MVTAKLRRGSAAVHIGSQGPTRGTIAAVQVQGDLTWVTLRVGPGKEVTYQLDRWLVPARAYRQRSWEGWTVLPYAWVD
jgi:hypothetical protein